MKRSQNHVVTIRVAMLLVLLAGFTLLAGDGMRAMALDPATRESLSPFMNSIPPSKDFFCVGTGASNRVRHPDRAPHTRLAQQDGVILFSGAAPQRGLNFALNAGSLVYRNQMSTLGSVEPPPQVGTAGTLQQGAGDFSLPCSEARWHPGEDISWYGYRAHPNWIGGLPYWAYVFNENPPAYPVVGGGESLFPQPYRPLVWNPAVPVGGGWNLHSSFNLQLARGIYQASKVRASLDGSILSEAPSAFREPWFQARGLDPAFNVVIDGKHLAGQYFPTYHNIYPFTKLELDGGRLVVDFERSATWPRTATTYNPGDLTSGPKNVCEKHCYPGLSL